MDFPPLSILCAGRERRSSTSYFHDNRRRRSEPVACVLQRTRSGLGFIEVDGTRHNVPAGHAMLFAHGDRSSYGCPPEAYSGYALDFVTMTGGGLPELFQSLQRQIGSVVAIPEDCEASRLLDDLVDGFLRRVPENRFRESAHVYRLLMLCAELACHEMEAADPVRHAREYILKHHTRPFTQTELAREVGLSREYLARRFKAEYGQSPGRFCAEQRLSLARELLQVTHATVEQIAFQCGYLDAGTFSRAFKAEFGRSPGKFRPKDR